MEAHHSFQKVGKILEAMEITSNATRIRLVAFQLECESQLWWEAMTWEEFCGALHG